MNTQKTILHFALGLFYKNCAVRIGSFALLFILTSETLYAQNSYERSDIGSISVFVDDQVSDGCWTSTKEIRQYAHDMLEQKGLIVNGSTGGEYVLVVSAFGSRDGTGFCNVHTETQLVTGALIENRYEKLVPIKSKSGIVGRKDNANITYSIS